MHLLTTHSSREERVSTENFSNVSMKIYVESHNICLRGEIRKISVFFGRKQALSGAMPVSKYDTPGLC